MERLIETNFKSGTCTSVEWEDKARKKSWFDICGRGEKSAQMAFKPDIIIHFELPEKILTHGNGGYQSIYSDTHLMQEEVLDTFINDKELLYGQLETVIKNLCEAIGRPTLTCSINVTDKVIESLKQRYKNKLYDLWQNEQGSILCTRSNWPCKAHLNYLVTTSDDFSKWECSRCRFWNEIPEVYHSCPTYQITRLNIILYELKNCEKRVNVSLGPSFSEMALAFLGK